LIEPIGLDGSALLIFEHQTVEVYNDRDERNLPRQGDELDQSLVDSVKAAFKDKEIEIAVYERDETSYLLRAPANRDHLVRAIADVESATNLVTPNQDEFK
jgi:antitoxin YefM